MRLTRNFDIQNLAGVFLGIALAVTALQAVFGPTRVSTSAQTQPSAGAVCVGEAIAVAYPYGGGQHDPHECRVQCEDGKRRYILYTNDLATQCQPPPGCSDWGEDMGVTCVPPGESS